MSATITVGSATAPATSTKHGPAGGVAEVLFTRDQIALKVEELGAQVARDYQEKAPLLMPILKGGFIIAADLVRALHPCPPGMTLEFVSARSYGKGTETSGTVEVSFDASAVTGRHVLLVDDLCDSGLTLQTVHRLVAGAGAASVRSLVLLDKRGRRKVEYDCDYVGFPCPNQWVAGVGMDTNQVYRGMSDVVVLTPEAIHRALARE